MTKQNQDRLITREVAMLDLGFQEENKCGILFLRYKAWNLCWSLSGQAYVKIGLGEPVFLETVGDLINAVRSETVTRQLLIRLGWKYIGATDAGVQQYRKENVVVDFDRSLVTCWYYDEEDIEKQDYFEVKTLCDLYDRLEDSRILNYTTDAEKIVSRTNFGTKTCPIDCDCSDGQRIRCLHN